MSNLWVTSLVELLFFHVKVADQFSSLSTVNCKSSGQLSGLQIINFQGEFDFGSKSSGLTIYFYLFIFIYAFSTF